jgi:hypothetical protein
MYKKIVSVLLIMTLALSASSLGFAGNQEKVIKNTKKYEEITDLEVLHKRAEEKKSDLDDDYTKGKEKKNAIMKNNKTGEVIELETIHTTQLLSETKAISLDNSIEATNNYATTYFATASLDGTQNASDWDEETKGVMAYSTIYWAQTTDSRGQTTVYMTKATGGWDKADGTISVLDREVLIGQNGVDENGPVTNQDVVKNPSGLTFSYTVNFSRPVLVEFIPVVGITTDATLSRGTASWHLQLVNRL